MKWIYSLQLTMVYFRSWQYSDAFKIGFTVSETNETAPIKNSIDGDPITQWKVNKSCRKNTVEVWRWRKRWLRRTYSQYGGTCQLMFLDYWRMFRTISQLCHHSWGIVVELGKEGWRWGLHKHFVSPNSFFLPLWRHFSLQKSAKKEILVFLWFLQL